MSEAPATPAKRPAGRRNVELPEHLKAYKGVWVFIEHDRGHVHSVSWELLGEARKLAMAYGLGRQVWAMVLDEPTNHPDMAAIERLEVALVVYPGAMVIVTHDDALARRCTSVEWRLNNGRVEVR